MTSTTKKAPARTGALRANELGVVATGAAIVRLSSHAKRINGLHEGIAANLRQSLHDAIEIGGLLAQVKASLPHGEWGAWIGENLTFTARTATNYIKLHEERDRLLKSETVSDLAGAYRLLREPKLPPNAKIEIVSDIEVVRIGGAICNQGGDKKSKGHNDHLIDTAEKMAAEAGVYPKTIQRGDDDGDAPDVAEKQKFTGDEIRKQIKRLFDQLKKDDKCKVIQSCTRDFAKKYPVDATNSGFSAEHELDRKYRRVADPEGIRKISKFVLKAIERNDPEVLVEIARIGGNR